MKTFINPFTGEEINKHEAAQIAEEKGVLYTTETMTIKEAKKRGYNLPTQSERKQTEVKE